MKTMRADILAAGLDQLYADRAYLIEKFTIITYGRGKEDEIELQLERWAAAGYLEILKPLRDCKDREPCIRLLRSIPATNARNTPRVRCLAVSISSLLKDGITVIKNGTLVAYAETKNEAGSKYLWKTVRSDCGTSRGLQVVWKFLRIIPKLHIYANKH